VGFRTAAGAWVVVVFIGMSGCDRVSMRVAVS